jgi:hypothetical protein
MNTILAEIEKNTRKLPVDDREKLAMMLLETVHNQELNDVDLAWIGIAEARFEDYRSGRDPGIPEDEFFGGIQQDLGWK